MQSASATSRTIFALALLTAFAGCLGPGSKRVPVLDKSQLLDAYRQEPDTIRRTMECLQKDAEGNCVAVKCTASPAGEIFSCNSYAKACLDNGLHWTGTNNQGVCAAAV